MRYWVGGLLLVIILFILVPIGIWQFRVETSDIKGRGEVTMTVNSSGNRMTQYNRFFDICSSVRNAEETIDRETARLETETIPKEKSHIQANISAAHTARTNGITEYNNMAANYTSEQFQDSDLPSRLVDSPYEAGGTKTVCTA